MRIEKKDLLATLKKVWGYQDFRYPQVEVIQTMLTKRDSLVVMPTGGGKSLCFQLPALLQSGLTVVVSPLVALIENQVRQLQQKKIAAGLIHSQIAKSDRRSTIANLAQLKLLYIAPETLLTPPIWELLSQPNLAIQNLVVDEAHCLVEWGNSFRPSYNRLGTIRKSLESYQSFPITLTAFTATADRRGREIISQSLGLKQAKKFILNPYRPNLKLQFKTVWTPKCRRDITLNFIRDRRGQSGLVYVRSRKNSEELAQWLLQQGLKTEAYHAGIISSKRRLIEQAWLAGKLPFVICTSAFGMGIDKLDCRFVLHYHRPQLLTEYLQEIGRSGRDSQVATALTLVSEPTGWLDREDKQRNYFFDRQAIQKYRQAKQIYKQIPDRGNIFDVTREIPQSEIALGILQNAGSIAWQDPFNYYKTNICKPITFRDSSPQSKIMSDFVTTKKCRWQYILKAFGFPQKARNFSCGKCDRCLKSSR